LLEALKEIIGMSNHKRIEILKPVGAM